MSDELDAVTKKILARGVGEGLGMALSKDLPNIMERAEESKREYIERLTRIETKLDVLINLARDIQ